MMMAIHVSLGVGMDLSQVPNSIAFFQTDLSSREKHEMLSILNYGYVRDGSRKTALKVMTTPVALRKALQRQTGLRMKKKECGTPYEFLTESSGSAAMRWRSSTWPRR